MEARKKEKRSRLSSLSISLFSQPSFPQCVCKSLSLFLTSKQTRNAVLRYTNCINEKEEEGDDFAPINLTHPRSILARAPSTVNARASSVLQSSVQGTERVKQAFCIVNGRSRDHLPSTDFITGGRRWWTFVRLVISKLSCRIDVHSFIWFSLHVFDINRQWHFSKVKLYQSNVWTVEQPIRTKLPLVLFSVKKYSFRSGMAPTSSTATSSICSCPSSPRCNPENMKNNSGEWLYAVLRGLS